MLFFLTPHQCLHYFKVVLISALTLVLASCYNSPNSRIESAEAWFQDLELNLTAIAQRGYGDKKRLSEALGIYWKLYRYANAEEKLAIRDRAMPLFKYTQNPHYVNFLLKADAKNFKKNSMSYFRIMWLLKEMDFRITHLEQGLQKILPKMNAHLNQRGPWQRAMFAKYYDAFSLPKPNTLKGQNKGVVSQRLKAKQYENINQAYRLTHQVFVTYNYGAKKQPTRFNGKDNEYLMGVLPDVTIYYIEKENWDLVAELITCMTYLGMSETEQFKTAYLQLLNAQNDNGSWGAYEKLRSKYGKYTDAKYYLHTTGVVLEAIIETERGKW